MGDTISIYIRDEELIEKLDRKVEAGVYRNRSHAVEEGLSEVL